MTTKIYDFCTSESQTLADLTAIEADLNLSVVYCEIFLRINLFDSDIKAEDFVEKNHIRNALARAAIIIYCRCWLNGTRLKLDETYLSELPEDLALLHGHIYNIRNKWAAHSVNHFDEVKIGIRVDRNNDQTKASLQTCESYTHGFEKEFIKLFHKLISNIKSKVDLLKQNEFSRIEAICKTLSIEEITLRPEIPPFSPKDLSPEKRALRFNH